MRQLRVLASAGMLAAICCPLFAQNAPPEFQGVSAELSTQLAASTLTRGWDGSKYPVLFGAELVPASAYTAVLQPGYYERTVTPHIDALQSLGNVRVVKFLLHYPLLYLPFYTDWPEAGGRAAYDGRMAFYKRLIADLHSRGIRVMIQSMAQGFGDFASISSDPLNLAGYYKTVSFDQYITGRAAQAVTICRELQPDYLSFESEPDFEANKSLQSALDPSDPNLFVRNNLRLVTTIRDAIEKADPAVPGVHSSLRLIIGMGSWERYLETMARAYATMPGIDIIDIHVHPINKTPVGDYLANIGVIADMAIASGKAVGMNETWLYHQSTAELGKVSTEDVEVRQNWSFFAPVDTAFLTLMMNLANYKHMEYVSFGWPNIFFSYLDYENTPGCSTPPWNATCRTAQWNSAANRAVALAIASKPVPLTATGRAFRDLLAAQPSAGSTMTVVSAASFAPGVAPDSLVSIFGERLSTGTAAASGRSLPATLAGTAAAIRGSDGVWRALSLGLASPRQVNALVPADAPAGDGEVMVTASDGTVSRAAVSVTAVAPGIFTATGGNVAAALVVVNKADGSQVVQYTAQCSGQTCSAAPVELGTQGETSALVLYGTGLRGASVAEVSVTVGGVETQALFSGAQSQFAGLDQVNVVLPQSLVGRGMVEVRLTARGVAANPVVVNFR